MKLAFLSAVISAAMTWLIVWWMGRKFSSTKRTQAMLSSTTARIKPFRLSDNQMRVDGNSNFMTRRKAVYLDFLVDTPQVVSMRFDTGVEFMISRLELKKIVDVTIERIRETKEAVFYIPMKYYSLSATTQSGGLMLAVKENDSDVQWVSIVLNGIGLQQWLNHTYEIIDREVGDEQLLYDQIDQEWEALAKSLEKE